MTDTDAGDFPARITAAYAATGPAVDLGRGVLGGVTHPDAVVQLSASMCNRHGLIAGATGTGKTKTLQLMAEQLSAMGVPVFAADIKGDLSGLTQPGAVDERTTTRASELAITWEASGHPVTFLSLGGLGPGVPVRATVSSFGPQLLAKVLGSNDTQTSSLSLVFHYADGAGLALLDLADLRSVLQFLTSDDGKAELKSIGGLSSATAGVLLRDISELEQQGGEAFFGEPGLNTADLLRTTPEGQGSQGAEGEGQDEGSGRRSGRRSGRLPQESRGPIDGEHRYPRPLRTAEEALSETPPRNVERISP